MSESTSTLLVNALERQYAAGMQDVEIRTKMEDLYEAITGCSLKAFQEIQKYRERKGIED